LSAIRAYLCPDWLLETEQELPVAYQYYALLD
jgi:hypothetical protein